MKECSRPKTVGTNKRQHIHNQNKKFTIRDLDIN